MLANLRFRFPIRSSMRIMAAAMLGALMQSGAVLSATDVTWGDSMFDTRDINFGNVARYSETKLKVKVTNPFDSAIQVTSVGTSCGCISFEDRAPISIAGKQHHELTIKLDTVRHQGDKNVKAFVTVHNPGTGSSHSVTIPVHGRIRQDFEVQPSYLGFGTIDLGKSYTQRVGVTYNGGSNFKITGAKIGNKFFTPEVVETSRVGGKVTYEVKVVISDDAPVSTQRDQLILTTNETVSSEISIPVSATIEADITVVDVVLGTVVLGQAKSSNVIIRGKKPFKITGIERVVRQTTAKPTLDGAVIATEVSASTVANGGEDPYKFKIPATAAQLHMVLLTMTPAVEMGQIEEEFVVSIEGRAQPIRFKVRGRVADQSITDVKK